MRHHKVPVLVFTLLCAGAMLLTGCAGGATQVVAPTAALAPEAKVSSDVASPTTVPEPAMATAPEADEPLIARAAVDPTAFTDFDPSSTCVSELYILINVYETLTRYTPLGSKDALEPGLATSWSVSDDGMTWTFKLREGAKFHDGVDFDASAVKRSIERTKNRGQCAAYLLDPVSEILTPDPYTVVFKLAYPAPLDAILASPYGAWIMSPGAADKDAAWFAAGNEAGTGPYRFARYEPGQRLVVQRFDDYWGGWQPGQFDTVVFEMLDDNVAAEQMLRAGELDFANQIILTPDQMAGLDGTNGLRLGAAPSVGNLLVFLNHRRPPTDDVRVRQALAYSFPYKSVVANTFLGKGTLAHSAVPTSVWGHDPEPSPYVEDLDKAASLLMQAGHADGLELTLSYDPANQTLAELWQANLAKIGVTLKLEPADFPIRWDAAKAAPEKAPEAFLFGWTPDVADPYSYLFNMFHTEDQPLWNLGFYSDPAFDTLIDQARRQSAVDQTAASAQYIDAQRMLADDAAAIFAVDAPELNIIAGDLRGFETNLGYAHLAYWYDLRREQ